MDTVYLVFHYESFYDTTRNLMSIWRNIDNAKTEVTRLIAADWDYMVKNPTRYKLDGQMITRWINRDSEILIEMTDEGGVTKTGKWVEGWIRYAIVSMPIY